VKAKLIIVENPLEICSPLVVGSAHKASKPASLCGSVGKDFVYHACGQGFESRLM